MHLLIPYAASSAPDAAQALRSLKLPHLDQLLHRLALVQTDAGSASSLTPPHERVLARTCAMSTPDGCVPLAALAVAQSGREPGTHAWAWISPAHWDVGADHIDMADPRALELQEPESRALLAAMQAYFAEDGITLDYFAPERWLAHGALFDGLSSASLDRVVGREISPWMPSNALLRRLQNEMQMLLYTHPVNDARSARGAPTVNSFWVSGSGTLPTHAMRKADPELLVVDTLRDAALRGDWTLWAQAWVQADQTECRSLLESLRSGNAAQLTLCGERTALTFGNGQVGLMQWLQRLFAPITLHTLQDQL